MMVLAASDHLPGENLEFEIGHFIFHNYFLCSENNNKTFYKLGFSNKEYSLLESDRLMLGLTVSNVNILLHF